MKLGTQLPLEQRPRATCAVCLIQQHASWWAHVGDSRLYHVRGEELLRAQPRPQSRRAAAARGPDQRRAGAESPDAQFRRVLPRRGPDPARHGAEPRAGRSSPTTCCWCAPTASGARSRTRRSWPSIGTAGRAAREAAGARRARRQARRHRQRQHLRGGAALAGRLNTHHEQTLADAPPMSCGRCASRAGITKHAEGSVLVEFGDTQVLCTASVEDTVPPFLRGKGQGWVTAEYGMLPRSTHTRTRARGGARQQSGRTQEIQRLIGRSLRAVADLQGARRAHHHARLRRAAGRRRHAHRRDHRRLRGARRGLRAAGASGALIAASSAARAGGGGLGRHRRRRAGARPRLRRGLAGRDRHERRHEQRRRASSRSRARPRATRSAATSSMRC